MEVKALRASAFFLAAARASGARSVDVDVSSRIGSAIVVTFLAAVAVGDTCALGLAVGFIGIGPVLGAMQIPETSEGTKLPYSFG